MVVYGLGQDPFHKNISGKLWKNSEQPPLQLLKMMFFFHFFCCPRLFFFWDDAIAHRTIHRTSLNRKRLECNVSPCLSPSLWLGHWMWLGFVGVKTTPLKMGCQVCRKGSIGRWKSVKRIKAFKKHVHITAVDLVDLINFPQANSLKKWPKSEVVFWVNQPTLTFFLGGARKNDQSVRK